VTVECDGEFSGYINATCPYDFTIPSCDVRYSTELHAPLFCEISKSTPTTTACDCDFQVLASSASAAFEVLTVQKFVHVHSYYNYTPDVSPSLSTVIMSHTNEEDRQGGSQPSTFNSKERMDFTALYMMLAVITFSLSIAYFYLFNIRIPKDTLSSETVPFTSDERVTFEGRDHIVTGICLPPDYANETAFNWNINDRHSLLQANTQ